MAINVAGENLNFRVGLSDALKIDTEWRYTSSHFPPKSSMVKLRKEEGLPVGTTLTHGIMASCRKMVKGYATGEVKVKLSASVTISRNNTSK